jgi:hypothetical protein
MPVLGVIGLAYEAADVRRSQQQLDAGRDGRSHRLDHPLARLAVDLEPLRIQEPIRLSLAAIQAPGVFEGRECVVAAQLRRSRQPLCSTR